MTPEEKLTEWISRWGSDVLRLCRSQLHDAQLAEDAAQETLVKAWQAAPRFHPADEAHERAWLMRIALHACRDIQRSRWWRHEDRRVSPEDVPRERTDEEAERRELLMMVEALPDSLRLPLMLHHLTGLTLTETALALHVSRPTLNSRLRKAYRKLAIEWEGGEEE